MANRNEDVLRVETTLANVAATIRERQNGYSNDTFKIAHKFAGGATKYWTSDEGHMQRTGKITITMTTEQLRLAYDDTYYNTFTTSAAGALTIAADTNTVVISRTGVIVNNGSIDSDFQVNWDSGVGLFVQGSDGVVGVGTATVQAWKTATYPSVFSIGSHCALASEGSDSVEFVAGQFWDVASDRWEYSGNFVSTRMTLNDGMTLHTDASGGGAATLQVAEMELFHAKATGVTAGEFVINEDGENIDTRIESNTLTHAVFIDASADKVAIGHAAPDTLLHIEQDTADTDEVKYLLRLTETCDGAVADGFGVGIQFELENSTQATPLIAGSIAVLWEDDSDVDSDMVFSTMDGGSLAEKLRITAGGFVGVGIAIPVEVLHLYHGTDSCMLRIETDAATKAASVRLECATTWWQMGNLEADSNKLSFKNGLNDPAVYFGTDGQIYADLGGGTGNVTVFDDYDDPRELSNILQRMALDRGVEMGVLAKDKATGRYSMNVTAFAKLLAGACYQLDARLKKAGI